ncbi:MAG TPA: PilZ domain-containing protein [Candidatus Acidoferrum sp.]|nr:PilZ domain-containing protein [Candidatus Acidoferrum sp.]
MSSSAQQIPALTTTAERRFYPRIVPHAPIFVAFAEGKDSLLLNLSENGLLVSTPTELACNFVARISIPLDGLPKPVQVNVRVVWVSAARKLAGIQLLDLTEHDRQLIRKWGARESGQLLQSEPHLPLVVARPSTTSSQTPHAAPPLTEEPPSTPQRDIALPAPPLTARARSISAAAGLATYGVLIVTVGLVAALFVRNGAQAHYFARSVESAYESSAAKPLAQDIPASLPNPDTLKPGADSQPASLPPSVGAAGLNSARAGAPASQASAQTDKDAEDHFIMKNSREGTASAVPKTAVNSGVLTPGVPAPVPVGSGVSPAQNQRHASRKSSSSPSQPTLQATPPPDASRLIAESPAGSPNDQTQPAANPPATDSGPMSSTSPDLSAPVDAAPGASPASPDTPVAKDPMRNPTPANDVAAGTPSTIPSSPIVAPTRSASSRKPEAPVIQMDAPARQVLEIHLPSGYHTPFFNLPGERVLESPTATMRIQRSVRMPATHVRWSFNRNKKIVIGGLISRVDPQAALVQLIPGDSVRVRATVGKDGRVESVNPIYGPPHLAHVVADAVRQWRYQPTLMDGKPAETQCIVVVQFHPPAIHTAKK